VGFVALALVSAMVGNTHIREAVLGRFSTLDNLDGDKSYMVREVMNQRSLKLFELSPWFGIGPGRYNSIYVPLELPLILAGKSEESFMRRSAHNSYLSFLAEGGVIGALPLTALLLFLATRGALAAIALNRQGERWALGVYASFIAMSVHFWALAGLTGTHAWYVYGLLVATIVLGNRAHQSTSGISVRQLSLQPRPMFGTSRPAVVGY